MDLKKICQRYLFCTSPNELKFYGDLFWNKLKILERRSTIGGHPGAHTAQGRACPPRRALVGGGAPGQPPMPIFWYIGPFSLEKINKERTFGMERHRLEEELGQEHFCSPAERFRQGYF